MSTHRSYFSKNNTIISDSLSNTGRNPITDLYFGSAVDTIAPNGYTRFIFDLDLSQLFEKILNGTITTECVNNMTHTLTMTNTIRFDEDLLNSYNSDQRSYFYLEFLRLVHLQQVLQQQLHNLVIHYHKLGMRVLVMIIITLEKPLIQVLEHQLVVLH